MPLDRNHIDPIEERGGGILFAMISLCGVVPCSITPRALLEIAGDDGDSPQRAFIAHRGMIEAVASAKYDHGYVDPDGGITLRAIDFQR